MNLQVLQGVFVGLGGAVVGSFLNVVICRLPHDDQSIIRPRSRCPNCEKGIAWYDNLPVISFLILRGRCRGCSQSISWRYPLVELLTAGLALAIWMRFGVSKALAVHFVFTAALVAVTFIDIDHRIIPNEISLPGIVIGFACSFLWTGFWKSSLIGLLAGGGVLFVISLLYSLIRGREGMGMGDVKLLAMLGAWLGWQCLLFVFFLSAIQSLIVVVILYLAGVKLKPPLPEEWEEEEAARESARESAQAGQGALPPEAQTQSDAEPGEDEEEEVSFMGAAIPFGPFLALSAVEYLFLGEWFYSMIRGA